MKTNKKALKSISNPKTKTKITSNIDVKHWKAGDRYIYYNPATQKRITVRTTQLKSIKEFKGYIQDKGYFWGSRAYKTAIRINRGVHVTELINEKPLRGRRVRVEAEYKSSNKEVYYSTSSFTESLDNIKAIQELKDNAIGNIALQILRGNTSFSTSKDDGFKEYFLNNEDEYNTIFDEIKQDVIFKFVYPVYK